MEDTPSSVVSSGRHLLPDHTAAAIPYGRVEAVSCDLEAAFVEDRQEKKARKAVKAKNGFNYWVVLRRPRAMRRHGGDTADDR